MNNAQLKHFSIRVGGRVQGVFFRASAADMARALGLNGFVRNEEDGSVYIEVEGPYDKLLKFVEWAKKGPPHASVNFCEVSEGDLRNFLVFEIQR